MHTAAQQEGAGLIDEVRGIGVDSAQQQPCLHDCLILIPAAGGPPREAHRERPPREAYRDISRHDKILDGRGRSFFLTRLH